MTFTHSDVVIVGAGCAGLTAAIGLARTGFSVTIVETAKEPGSAGLIGGVCVADHLLQPEILGVDDLETLAWEQRLVERGWFATDGRRIAGNIYRDAEAFRSCYTVLRSRFTQYLTEAALAHGVVLRTETTVESLIREGRRIIGVATTRGPLYAALSFLTEGDAGLLLSREGLDRYRDPHDQPAFLYCLQQIIELPPGAIEERFRLGQDQGSAYAFLLRNPPRMPLNARGYFCTNRQGITLSVVVPAKSLHHYFRGEPRQLLDWFAEMPALQPWLRDGERGAWTATLLRTGGWRDIPYLVEDGLAVGGAAAGLGLDFPIVNLLGPATATGLLLCRAAVRIRAEGRGFDRLALVHHYLEPLQQTRCWRDMEFTHRWPGYLPRAHILFESGADLLLDSAAVWGKTRRWLPWKFFSWLRVLSRVSWRNWSELRDEFIQFSHVLRWREVKPRPPLTRLLLDGALNAFSDLVRRPRPHLPPHGTLRLYYHSAGEEGRASAVPWLFRRWFERFRPVLAAAEHLLYENNDKPLSVKLTSTWQLLLRQLNLFDFLLVAVLFLPCLLTSAIMAIGGYLFRRNHRVAAEVRSGGWVEHSEPPNDSPGTIEDSAHPASPLIYIAWQSTHPQQQGESVQRLPHLCPTRVFEVVGTPPETIRVIVHGERCIHCQACWRLHPLVDWGRSGTMIPSADLAIDGEAVHEGHALALGEAVRKEAAQLFDQFEHQLREYDMALGAGPSMVDRPHIDYLAMLARYAEQMTKLIRELLHRNLDRAGETQRRVWELIDALVVHAEERTRHVWQGRFAWAGADGRLLRQHHLAWLRRLLDLSDSAEMVSAPQSDSRLDWLPDMKALTAGDAHFKHSIAGLAARNYLLTTIELHTRTNELLAVLATEVRDGLSAWESELRIFSEENDVSIPWRDASVLTEAYARLGGELCEDLGQARKLLAVPGDWQRMAQLAMLPAEREELAESERRFFALAENWTKTSPQPADTEINAGFGKQAAHLLAGKLLLLRTFARFEKGDDAELALLLLRVWLDNAATLLDEHTIVVRERLQPAVRASERPLVEPDSGPPLRTQTEYLAAPATYSSGDFLLAPIDLLQPRLVPEMVGQKELAVAGPSAAMLLRLLEDIKGKRNPQSSPSRFMYVAEALTVETVGRFAAAVDSPLDLEWACTLVILAQPRRSGSELRARCVILRALAEVVIPRWLQGGMDIRARHLHRDVLEMETRKVEFRQRLTAAWQAYGEALGRNADIQASCFALAEAAAWLKAADSVLGRMAWLSRLSQAEEREEPPEQHDIGQRMLSYCFAEIRDRLFRFDEDLASLRRGYYAPHVYAATQLLRRILRAPEFAE